MKYSPDSQQSKLLLTLAEKAEATLTPEGLIRAAWMLDKATFGLRGFEDEQQDTRKLQNTFYGKRGLIRMGWVAITAAGLCRLTHSGKVQVATLKGEGPPESSVLLVPPQRLAVLARVFDSEAVRMLEANRAGEVTSRQAFHLWGLSDRADKTNADPDPSLAAVRDALAEVEGDVVLPGGRQLTPGEIRAAAHFVGRLEERFAGHLKLLRTRAAGRKEQRVVTA